MSGMILAGRKQAGGACFVRFQSDSSPPCRFCAAGYALSTTRQRDRLKAGFMDDVEAFLDRLRADKPLYARVRDAAEELIREDPEVSDEELGWAAVDLASATMEVPDDVEPEIGEMLREDMDDIR